MDRIRGPRDKHPSGKPGRRDERRDWPFRMPTEEPRTIGLRKDRGVTAIGFTANLVDDKEE